MINRYSVNLNVIAESQKLEPVHLAKNYDSIKITTADINRPAMQLTGFYNYFDARRIQIVGRVETTYLETLNSEARLAAFEKLLQYDIPALIVCHECEVYPECVIAAEKYDRCIFITKEDTSALQANIIAELRRYLGPRITVHGVLVEIYGEGVLITGESGIGKSETALELIKRGHRLISDDAVEIKFIDREILVGTAPEMIRYYMEIRGIGVINVRHLYGVGAIKPESNIDLIVHLEHWDDTKKYDRLGLDTEEEKILGVKIPKVTLPVRPGRNIAVVLELAAMNNRQKKMGFSAAEILATTHDNAIDRGIGF